MRWLPLRSNQRRLVTDDTPGMRKRIGPMVGALSRWGVILGGLLAIQGLGALSQIVLARRTTPQQYALYLSSTSLVALLVVLPGFGLDTWLLVRGAGRPEMLRSLWTAGVKLRALSLATWVAGMAVLVFWLPTDRYPIGLVICLAFAVAFESVFVLNGAALRAARRHVAVALLQAITAFLLLGAVLVIPDGTSLVTTFAIVKMILAASSMLASFVAVNGNEPSRPDGASVRDVMHESLPFLVSDLAVAVYLRADLTIVTLILGNQPASVYGPAVSLVNLLFLVPHALYLLVTPVLARLYGNSGSRYWSQSGVQMGAQLAIGMGLSGMVRFLAPPIVDLVLGPSYAASVDVLVRLSVVPLLKALSFGLAAILVTAEQQRRRTKAQVVSAVFNVAANLLLVQRYGLFGAVWAYVASEMLLLASYGIAVIRTRTSCG